MVFSSIPFLYYFLPAVLIVYFLAPWKFKNAVLLLFSLVFYGWGEPKLLLLMLFIMLNQLFQSELGYIPLRSDDMFHINYKNTSYIWGPGENDAIGSFLALFCPKFFKVIPVGQYAGQIKYWPWFWMIFPVFILVTPLSFGLCMIFDRKAFVADVRGFISRHFRHNSELTSAE